MSAAIPARLAELLADRHTPVRRAAAEAVGALGGTAATPAILARLTKLLAGARASRGQGGSKSDRRTTGRHRASLPKQGLLGYLCGYNWEPDSFAGAPQDRQALGVSGGDSARGSPAMR